MKNKIFLFSIFINIIFIILISFYFYYYNYKNNIESISSKNKIVNIGNLNNKEKKEFSIKDCNKIFNGNKIGDIKILDYLGLYDLVSHSLSFFEKENELKVITKKYLSGQINQDYLKNKFNNINKKTLGYSILSDFLYGTNLCKASKDNVQCYNQVVYLKYLFNNKKIIIEDISLKDFRLYYLYGVKYNRNYRKIFYKKIILECQKKIKS